MKTLSSTALLIGLSLVLALSVGPSSAAEPSKEVAAIQAVDAIFVKAYNSGDVDTVVAQYAVHAVLQPPGAPAADGKAAIHTFFATDIPAAAKEGAKFVLNPGAQGGFSGDLGWSSGTFHVKGKDGQVLDKGKYLSVSRKIGGKWLYIRDMWNSDNSPASAEPASPQEQAGE